CRSHLYSILFFFVCNATFLTEMYTLSLHDALPIFNAKDVNKHLGTNITISELEYILAKLRFPFTVEGELFTVSIPTRRGDIHIFEDMLEEIARIYGYDL